MRWVRLFLLGLASIYPIYWTTQFALFFLPASVRALCLRIPLHVVDISYLQATAIAGKPDALPIGFESLVAALLFSLAIWSLRGDAFLTGGLAIVVMGQSALLPFLNELFWQGKLTFESAFGVLVSLAIVCFGLLRVLRRAGGVDFVDRLALLSLLVVLPEALLWLTFRLNYPYIGAKFLLMLLIPVYLCALIVSGIPRRLKRGLVSSVRAPVTLPEILASFLVAGLLFGAIGLTTRSSERRGSADGQGASEAHGS
ncbi:MAG: hypothetical protein JSS69_13265 [Acidobacteria bacterium]|nr:hypothetical protein [Acidobacteriota bacterium]MBS1866878.1 hypothetical protein [Acidobacteriota bacterium]